MLLIVGIILSRDHQIREEDVEEAICRFETTSAPYAGIRQGGT